MYNNYIPVKELDEFTSTFCGTNKLNKVAITRVTHFGEEVIIRKICHKLSQVIGPLFDVWWAVQEPLNEENSWL